MRASDSRTFRFQLCTLHAFVAGGFHVHLSGRSASCLWHYPACMLRPSSEDIMADVRFVPFGFGRSAVCKVFLRPRGGSVSDILNSQTVLPLAVLSRHF